VADLFIKLSGENTTLPPTAQVASQQGEYLGKMLKQLAKEEKVLKANDIPDLDEEAYYTPFKYRHLGSLAYVGNSAVFDYYGFSVVGGLVGMYAWRSVYWSEQASIRSRFMLMLDWVKRGLFGRDLSKVSNSVPMSTNMR
jgi:NADH dehydrogenase